jgi:lysophospholipase L1-like esterase
MVKILGDSHLRDSSMRVNQYLNSKFEVTGFIKPGATAQHIVSTQDKDLKYLGKKDVIVINGGANDMDKVKCKPIATLALMISFIQKYNNSNILILGIPHRHDLHRNDRINLRIQAYNSKLKNILNRFKHVAML